MRTVRCRCYPAGPSDPQSKFPILHGFEFKREIGHGGMGIVYLATHDGQDYAVKAIHSVPDDPDRNMLLDLRFCREASIASQFNHPNIVHTLGFIASNPTNHFLVMEYLNGVSLETLLRATRLDTPTALSVTLKLCDAIGAVHVAGIIHCDVKPANVIIVDGVPKLIDFGLAKIVNIPTSANFGDLKYPALSVPNGFFGTPIYSAPEQKHPSAHSLPKYDSRVDIYSLGVILYKMLTGVVPFPCVDWRDLAPKYFSDPPHPCIHCSGIPKKLDDAIMSAIARDPKQRFNSAAEMSAALSACL